MPPNLPPKPPTPAPLTMQRMHTEGLLDELARVFRDGALADRVLDRLGFPREERPNFDHGIALHHWRTICDHVADGITEGGLDALVAAARHIRPFNRVFSQAGQPVAPLPVTDTEANHHPSLFVVSRRPAAEVLDQVRQLAVGRGIPGEVRLEMMTHTGLTVFGFDQATADQVLGLAEAVRAALAPTPAAGPVRVNVTSNGDRSTLLERLLAQGPDGSEFELSGIPASTPPRDIARAVMQDYAAAGAEPGAPGPAPARPVTVDHVQPDGTATRLDPDRPIGHQGVCDGDRLEINPESRAAVDPVLRGTALPRVRNEVVAFCTTHGVGVEVNEELTPTEYTLTFDANGWAPPDRPGAAPVPVTRHTVFIWLPPEFPIHAPVVQWLSPVFHPNVKPDPKDQLVCLGELMDQYEPGLDFGRLLRMLVDVAEYKNYRADSALNADAARWAALPEGQAAIEARGGVSLTRMYARQLADALGPPPAFRVTNLGRRK